MNSPQVHVKLSGETSVVHRDFDLRGTATLARTATAANSTQSFELPFLVLGSWDRPYLMPDPAALIRRSGAIAPLDEAPRLLAARHPTAFEVWTGAETDGQ